MKDDDRVLAALRDAVRAEEASDLADPRWERLAGGDLSDEERAELLRLAEENPELAGAPELFAPLGAEVEERFLAAVQHELQAPVADTAAPAAPVAIAPANDAPAKVVSLDSRRRTNRGWTIAATVVALAAGVTLWIGTRKDSGSAHLPAYAMIVTGGERDVRGDEPKAIVLSAGSRVTMALRPEKPAPGPVSARAFLVQDKAEIPLDASIEVSADGALRMVGRVPANAALVKGEAELAVAVGPEADFARPAAMDELVRRGDELRWVRQRVEVRAP